MRGSIAYAAAALACVALAGVARHPKPLAERAQASQRPVVTPERRRAVELGQDLALTAATARRLEWVDSLVPLTRGAADRPVPFALGAPASALERDGGLPALPIVADRLRDELRLLDVARPAVDLGVFLVSFERLPGVQIGSLNSFEWLAGESDGRPYCIAVRTSFRPARGDLLTLRWEAQPGRPAHILGPCAFYARHGSPGPQIQRWMLGPGGAHGLERPADLAGMTLRAPGAREVWLYRRRTVSPTDLGYDACLGGRTDACASMVLENQAGPGDVSARLAPKLVEAGVPVLASQPAGLGTGRLSAVASDRLLDALEQRFGADAFDRFWHSQKSVPEAFVEAFGTTPEAWGREWAREVYGDRDRADVMPAAEDGVLTLLMLALALPIAVGFSRRRRLG